MINVQIKDQTKNPTENFESMNLWQMSGVITWTQKKNFRFFTLFLAFSKSPILGFRNMQEKSEKFS